MIIDLILNGLIYGSTYALLAIGFSLIFGVARIINIAHTAFYMVAAFCIYLFTQKIMLNPFVAMIISVAVVTVLGLICYKLFINPIREHESAVLISTIALAMVFQELMHIMFGSEYLSVPSLIEGFMKIFGTKISYQQLLTFVMALVTMLGVWLVLKKTRIGLAIRSTAQDREVANLMGINEAKIAMITMGISVGLAAFTGSVIVPLRIISPHMWMSPLILMMAAVVLGGLGSIRGSFVGAFILGFSEALVVFLLPMGAYLKGSVALSIMIIVLIIRPDGLFGVSIEEER